MGLTIHRVEVWSGVISDRPGAAAAIIEALSRTGTDLHYVFTRPHPTHPDESLIFIAPIQGENVEKVARQVGLQPDRNTAMLCVEGENRPGIGSMMMSWLAVAGINLRGLSISSVGDRFAAYLAFDHPETATQGLQILANMA